MRYRGLAVLPLVLAAAFAAATMAGVVHASGMVSIGSIVGKLFALGGSLAAALAFERGDYLRRAWVLSGSCFLLLLLGDALELAGWAAAMPWLEALTAVLANAASVVGTWMLAHAFLEAGLVHDDDGRAPVDERVVLAGSLVLAIAVTGSALLSPTRAISCAETSRRSPRSRRISGTRSASRSSPRCCRRPSRSAAGSCGGPGPS